MKCVVLCFICIGFWNGIPLVQGEPFEYECDILQRLDDLETNYKETKQLLVSQEVKLNTANDLIAVLENKDKETQQLLLRLDNELKTAKEVIAALESNYTELRQGQAVGFTMRAPRASPTPHQLSFSTTISDVGGGYNVNTGVFSCSIPGYYHFSASLLKEFYHDGNSGCWMLKNNVRVALAITQPGHSPQTGAYAAVNSVFVHLDAGDNVTLSACTAIASFHGYSTFSGFLVTADVI